MNVPSATSVCHICVPHLCGKWTPPLRSQVRRRAGNTARTPHLRTPPPPSTSGIRPPLSAVLFVWARLHTSTLADCMASTLRAPAGRCVAGHLGPHERGSCRQLLLFELGLGRCKRQRARAVGGGHQKHGDAQVAPQRLSERHHRQRPQPSDAVADAQVQPHRRRARIGGCARARHVGCRRAPRFCEHVTHGADHQRGAAVWGQDRCRHGGRRSRGRPHGRPRPAASRLR
mmetsp:Transcript_2817/g.7592  ORF Transcript_2817/g.7592 Transcript_2817/m.7592 type:complete len:230 (-) Transcript_2817:167-856(-)